MENLADTHDSCEPLKPSRDAGSSRAEPTATCHQQTHPTSVGASLEGSRGTESEALSLPAGVAGLSAAQPRILDTLETLAQRPELQDETGRSESNSVLPGQRALGLDGVPEQYDLFDGLGYAIPSRVYDQDERPRRDPRLDLAQLAFAFPVGGVQMHFSNWHRERDASLRYLADQYPRGKLRRTFRRIADRGDECGSLVRSRVCDHGHIENKEYVASHCGSRTCPASARADALELRTKLFAAVKHWPTKRTGASWMFHTVTVRCPRFVTVQRLMVDRRRAFAGWKAGWQVIRKICGGERAIAHLEVGTGGMVHVHVLAYHRFITPYQLTLVRDAILSTVGGGTTQYRVDRVGTGKRERGAVKEVAKYVTKGVAMNNSSANQTHPLLASLIEVAFRSMPLTVLYGKWKGLNVEAEEEEGDSGWQCPTCGSASFRWHYHDKTTGAVARVEPRFAKRPRPPPGDS